MSAEEQEDRDIEQMLRQLPLASPREQLDGRISATLAGDRLRMKRWRGYMAAAACVGLVFVLAWAMQWVIRMQGQEQPRDRAVVERSDTRGARRGFEFRPVRYEKSEATLVDEGMAITEAGEPIHRFRRQGTRQIWLIDEARNIRVAIEVPVDEVVYVKAAPF